MTDAAVSLTQAQLNEMVAAEAAKAVGPAVEAALKPFTEKQAAHQGLFDAMVQDRQEKAAADPSALLGKYPIGRKVRALAMAKLENGSGDPDAAIHAIGKAAGWPKSIAEPTVKWLQYVKTTLLAGNAAAAGDMIMPQYDPEWIELLRNNAVIRGMCRTVPMPRGATARRKQTASGTAYYQGETDKITPSNQTVGRATLSYKKLTAATVVGNDLIRFSGGEADRFVQEDLLRVMALREDRAFINGNPPVDAGSPQGIRYQTAGVQVVASAGTTLANFQSDLTTAIQAVETANIPTGSLRWLISPGNYWTIFALATTTGDMIFMTELAQGRLFGIPIVKTTQLAVGNSWIGASAGMIMLVAADLLEIHDSMQRTVAVYPGGAYYDPALSAVASGISNDETVITCIAEHDFLQVYDKAAYILTGYTK